MEMRETYKIYSLYVNIASGMVPNVVWQKYVAALN